MAQLIFLFSATAAERSSGNVFRRETVLSCDRVTAQPCDRLYVTKSVKLELVLQFLS